MNVHMSQCWCALNLGIGTEHVNMVHQFPPLQSAPSSFVHILRTWPCLAQKSLNICVNNCKMHHDYSPPRYSLGLNAQGVRIQTRMDTPPES